jgi:hypothetical protein
MDNISYLMDRNIELLDNEYLYNYDYFLDIKYCFLELKIFSNIYTDIVKFYNDNSWIKDSISISIIHKIDLCIIKMLQIFCSFLEIVNNNIDTIKIVDLIINNMQNNDINYEDDFKKINKQLYTTKNTLKQLLNNLKKAILISNPNYILDIPIYFLQSNNVHSHYGKMNYLKNNIFSMKGINSKISHSVLNEPYQTSFDKLNQKTMSFDEPNSWNFITGNDDKLIYINILKSRRYTIQFPIYDNNNIFGWFKQMFNKINIFYITTKNDNLLFLQCLYSNNLYKYDKNTSDNNCIIINVNKYKIYLKSISKRYNFTTILSQFDQFIYDLIIESKNKIKQYTASFNKKTKGFNYSVIYKNSMFISLSKFYKNNFIMVNIYICNYCNRYQSFNNNDRVFCCLYCSTNNCTFCNIQYNLDTTHICSDNTVEGCKKCPQCGINTFKDDGCDKILCSRCKCAWCYMCGEKTIIQLSDIETIMENNGTITNINSLLYLHYSNNCSSLTDTNQYWHTDINQFYIISDFYQSPLSQEQKNKFIQLFSQRSIL